MQSPLASPCPPPAGQRAVDSCAEAGGGIVWFPKGIFFRHINGLTLENVAVESYLPDAREDFFFEDVTDLKQI